MTSNIDDFLAETRQHLDRVRPEDVTKLLGEGALVVDIRPDVNRDAEGSMPGAVVIDRNVLEWRLDPTSPDRIPEATAGRRIVLFCNDGYASSLAARTLQLLGIEHATDLDGGYRGWVRASDVARAATGDRSDSSSDERS